MNTERLRYLINRYSIAEITPAERQELYALMAEPGFAASVTEDMKDSFFSMQEHPEWNNELAEKYWTAIKQVLQTEEPVRTKIHFLRRPWIKYAAAILLITGISTYLWNKNTSERSETVWVQPIKKDIPPGGQRALLTLADGSTIVLDSAANGQLAMQGNSKVIKLDDGQLIYSEGQPIPSHGGVVSPNGETGVGSVQRLTTNTMSTPRGGQYQLTLSDGTKVWLNAASSITYPTAFTANNRTVQIKGEAYFEVSQNKLKPFIVKSGDNEITVLGTSFNINAYGDEPVFKTSLIEGAIKVNNKIIQPGQAYVSGKIINTNIQQDIAWKNGGFDFTDITIAEAARQISRWYDVEIQFDGPAPQVKITGGFHRSVTLQGLLKGIDGEFAHFRLVGKVLHIKALS
ncbi:MAG: FecR family protein [Chitinophagaceae bacterium]|nr:FecR family protein [Chitinophagaceae bacterium]